MRLVEQGWTEQVNYKGGAFIIVSSVFGGI